MREYEDPDYTCVIVNKIFYCSVDNECRRFYCDNRISKSENIAELFGDHVEADKEFLFHAKHADSISTETVVVRANDTVIFVILLKNNHVLLESNLWYYFVLDSANSFTCIDITDLSKQIEYLQALSGIYALTGINYISSFFQKVKIRPLILMTKGKICRGIFISR